jgi:hypothetical protein
MDQEAKDDLIDIRDFYLKEAGYRVAPTDQQR